MLFLGSMAFMVVFSFWRTVELEIVPEWNLDNYLDFFQSPTYPGTFLKTLVMAGVVTLACLAPALPFTFYLVRYVSRRWQRLVRREAGHGDDLHDRLHDRAGHGRVGV